MSNLFSRLSVARESAWQVEKFAGLLGELDSGYLGEIASLAGDAEVVATVRSFVESAKSGGDALALEITSFADELEAFELASGVKPPAPLPYWLEQYMKNSDLAEMNQAELGEAFNKAFEDGDFEECRRIASFIGEQLRGLDEEQTGNFLAGLGKGPDGGYWEHMPNMRTLLFFMNDFPENDFIFDTVLEYDQNFKIYMNHDLYQALDFDEGGAPFADFEAIALKMRRLVEKNSRYRHKFIDHWTENKVYQITPNYLWEGSLHGETLQIALKIDPDKLYALSSSADPRAQMLVDNMGAGLDDDEASKALGEVLDVVTADLLDHMVDDNYRVQGRSEFDPNNYDDSIIDTLGKIYGFMQNRAPDTQINWGSVFGAVKYVVEMTPGKPLVEVVEAGEKLNVIDLPSDTRYQDHENEQELQIAAKNEALRMLDVLDPEKAERIRADMLSIRQQRDGNATIDDVGKGMALTEDDWNEYSLLSQNPGTHSNAASDLETVTDIANSWKDGVEDTN